MSVKNLDKHNRFRSRTVGFRVSPEESELLNRTIAISGLSKQEYCYRRCMSKDIVVHGNSRVFRALREELVKVYEELSRIEKGGEVSSELIELLTQINKTLYGMKEGEES